jgi:2-oxoacid dehydrogenases acyltransferase (catalytic domain)
VAGGPDDTGGSAAALVGANGVLVRTRQEQTLTTPATSRLRLVVSQLIDQLRMPLAPGQIHPYPRLRNFVLDVLAEGRRKQIAHILLEADVEGIKEDLAELRLRGEPVSMTSYIAKSFACAIANDKRMQAYRLGRSRLVVFDDVDLAFMVEREWEGEVFPVFYILRAAQQKTVFEIHRELRAARETPLGTVGPMSALEMQFFRLPAFLRKALWFFIRRNPYWFKDLAGTAGVTSMGMFTSGAAVAVPITPMTLTLTIGTIEKKMALQHGQAVERDVVHLNLSVDHDVVDGAPLMRFAERFKQILRDRTALMPSANQPEEPPA